MNKQIEVNKKYANYKELKSLYNTEKNSKIKIRLLIIMHFYDGYSSAEIGKLVKQAGVTVGRILHRYNKKRNTWFKRYSSSSKRV